MRALALPVYSMLMENDRACRHGYHECERCPSAQPTAAARPYRATRTFSIVYVGLGITDEDAVRVAEGDTVWLDLPKFWHHDFSGTQPALSGAVKVGWLVVE